jgi:hypothetical protein
VVYQDLIADLNAVVADIHSTGTLRRIRDEGVYLVLSFAAKRTSEDFILVALGEHKSSMPRERWKSRCAKVQMALLIDLRFCGLRKASKDAVPGSQKIACLRPTFQPD